MTNSEPHTPISNFTPADLLRLTQETFVKQYEYHQTLNSTNDRALQLAAESNAKLPLLVLADGQTAGRGRGANLWRTSTGALTFSLLFDCQASQLPTDRWPLLSLTTGLAICESLEHFLPTADVRLKWPNDVYVDSRKISGILIEARPTPQPKLVLGIGINVNNSLATAPPQIAYSATSLTDMTGKHFSLNEVLLRVLKQLEHHFHQLRDSQINLPELWQKRCLLTGREVKIDTVTNSIQGHCEGIDPNGALIVNTENGPQHCLSGTVTLLDPS